MKVAFLSRTAIFREKNSKQISKKTFSVEEDGRLLKIVEENGPEHDWTIIAARLGTRNARQCKERWEGYLDPNIRVAPWSIEEEELLFDQVQLIGTKWGKMVHLFNGRSANDLKNRWYSHIKDNVILCMDGKLRIARNPDGTIMSSKKKRRRKPISHHQRGLECIKNMEAVESIISVITQHKQPFDILPPGFVFPTIENC